MVDNSQWYIYKSQVYSNIENPVIEGVCNAELEMPQNFGVENTSRLLSVEKWLGDKNVLL